MRMLDGVDNMMMFIMIVTMIMTPFTVLSWPTFALDLSLKLFLASLQLCSASTSTLPSSTLRTRISPSGLDMVSLGRSGRTRTTTWRDKNRKKSFHRWKLDPLLLLSTTLYPWMKDNGYESSDSFVLRVEYIFNRLVKKSKRYKNTFMQQNSDISNRVSLLVSEWNLYGIQTIWMKLCRHGDNLCHVESSKTNLDAIREWSNHPHSLSSLFSGFRYFSTLFSFLWRIVKYHSYLTKLLSCKRLVNNAAGD